MKKILALVLVFATVFAFAACGKKEEATVTETTLDAAALDKELEEALKNTQAAVTKVEENVVTEVATNAEGQTEIVTEIVTEVVTEASKGLTSGDAALIADYYNKAVAATIVEDANGNATLIPKGWQTMILSKKIDGKGAIGTILKVLQPVVDKVLADNAKETTWIPGGKEGDLLATDIQKGTAISKDGKTTLTIMIKEQVDGPDCDGNTAGPVARGISTLGSIDTALEALGATLSSGRDTVKLTYKDAYIKCVIDEETGRIESGTWFYTVDIYIGDAQAKLAGIPANLKELTAAIDYKVVID